MLFLNKSFQILNLFCNFAKDTPTQFSHVARAAHFITCCCICLGMVVSVCVCVPSMIADAKKKNRQTKAPRTFATTLGFS